MPRKITAKKTAHRKTAINRPDTLTFRGRSDHHGFVPEFYRTTATVVCAGTIPASTGPSFSVFISGNSAHIPFYSTIVGSNSIYALGFTTYSSLDSRTLQPQGFTNLMGTSTGLYSKYRVNACKLRYRLTPTSTSDNIHVVASTVLPSVPANSSIITALAAPNSSGIQTYTSIENNKWLVFKRSTAQVYGTNPSAIRDDLAYSALANAAPTNEWAFVLVHQVVDATSTNQAMGYVIELEYDIEFFGRQTGALADTLVSNTQGTSMPLTEMEIRQMKELQSRFEDTAVKVAPKKC